MTEDNYTIKYRVTGYTKSPIVEVKVVNETECFYTFIDSYGDKHKRAKVNLFDNYDDAKQVCISRAKMKVANYETCVKSAKETLELIKNLTIEDARQ